MRWNGQHGIIMETGNNKPRYMSSALPLEDETFPLSVLYCSVTQLKKMGQLDSSLGGST